MKNIGIHHTPKKNYICFSYFNAITKMNVKLFFSILLFCAFASIQNIEAQNLDFVRQNEVSVEVNGKALKYPWIGGFNNPQFSEVDLNNDGILDLFVFDRASNSHRTFTHSGVGGASGYEYAPELEGNFPELDSWALMLDYDCDEVPDIFTSNSNGIRIYKGSYTMDSKISFQFILDKLTYDIVNEIFVSEFDIPAISDINNDGDIDILTFNITGGFIEYFENLAVENNAACGELSNFEMASSCWGGTYENFFDRTLTLDTCAEDGKKEIPIAPYKAGTVHPGSTLLAIDLDGDIDKDIILGDIAFSSMTMAMNGGTPDFANMMSQDTLFPSNTIPINTTTFPAAFSIDYNRDGKKDLLVSPNAAAQSNHFQCISYYTNIGTDTNHSYSLQTNLLMVDETIDVSAYSRPTFFDHNGDGLLDLVIGNEGYEIPVSEFSSYLKPSLALYENVGTSQQPAFKLVNRDYMEIGTQLFTTQFDPNIESALFYHPTFGDLDNDGDEDLLIGDNMGYVHRFENQPNAQGIAQFVKKTERMPDNTGAALDVKQLASPQLIDVNGDGLLDLISGNHTGKIYYYQNTGTLQNPIFTLQSKEWGAVSVREGTVAEGHAIPYLFKMGDGTFRLLVGNDPGKIYLFSDIEANIDGGPFTLITEQVISSDGLKEASPSIADLDDDGRLDMIIGNLRGGILWYETENIVNIEAPLSETQAITFYPNPATSTLYFDWQKETLSFNAPITVQIYNTLGQLVLTSMIEAEQSELSIEELTTGLYLVEMRVEGALIGGEKLLVK
ncbi:MAG: T9SS type A sorting domain-containing protein [Chitinophagales bacterium]